MMKPNKIIFSDYIGHEDEISTDELLHQHYGYINSNTYEQIELYMNQFVDNSDTSTVASTTTVTTTSTNASSVTVSPSVGSIPRVPRVINNNFDLNSWKSDGKVRYLLSDLFNFEKGRMDKKITEEGMSDAVVWNIIFLEYLCDLPTESPADILKQHAVVWLVEFRKQITVLLKEMIQQKYLAKANSREWVGIRGPGMFFTTYKDLVQQTSKKTSELVCTHIVLIFFYH